MTGNGVEMAGRYPLMCWAQSKEVEVELVETCCQWRGRLANTL